MKNKIRYYVIYSQLEYEVIGITEKQEDEIRCDNWCWHGPYELFSEAKKEAILMNESDITTLRQSLERLRKTKKKDSFWKQ